MRYIFTLLSLISWTAVYCAEATENSLGNVRVLAVLSKVPDAQGEHVVFCGVGFDIAGQIIYLRRFDNRDRAGSFLKIGQRFVNYLGAKIVSDPKGSLSFEFEKCTAGSSLSVIGKDGKMKDIFDLPKGIFPDSEKRGYFANVRIISAARLPIIESSLDASWSSNDALQVLLREVAQSDDDVDSKLK